MPRYLIHVLFAVLLLVPFSAAAQDGPPLRLKTRAFVPPPDVRSPQARAERRARADARRLVDPAARQHLIVQFNGPIRAADLADLRRAGASVLRYVPDHALSISAPLDFDPATLSGARWAGDLTAADRVSPDARADLGRAVPQHPLMFIEFHADATAAAVASALGAAGTSAVPRRGLPSHLTLIPAEAEAIERLAHDERVAWIYPARPNEALLSDPVCQGVATPMGLVAEFATVGDGWDGPGQGAADLRYHFQALTGQVGAATSRAEIVRALDEWSRHIRVSWNETSHPQAARSLTILWGVGDHGDGYPFSTDVLAHAFYQAPVTPEPLAGDVHFNDSFAWGAGTPSRYDIFSVMLHEAGHSLGLAHASDPNAVMYPIYHGIVPGLAPADIAAARQLYAPAGSLPDAWSGQAIGPGVAAHASESGGVFTLGASGRDVWDIADEFGFVSRTLSGDGDIVARVDALAAVDRWTKAGVMIRATDRPDAPHAFVIVSGERGLAFQRRRNAGGVSVHTDGGPGRAPYWVWLSRRGNRFDAYVAPDGGAWRLIGSDTIAMGPQVLAGLALTGHAGSAIATASFSNVSVTTSEWRNQDIGSVGRVGALSITGSQYRVTGAGADIWNTADAFHYAWQQVSGDVEIIARVATVQNTDRWAKAGVMIRASTDAGAAHAFMLVSPGKGYAFQRRLAQGGISYHTPGANGTAPQWVRLVRKGQSLTAYHSGDGTSWAFVGTESIPMGQTVLVGLAVSSHTTSATCLAVFEHVTIR